ncbi:MAG: glycosyltransferase family 4 protein [Pelistega sp.]|nr:glycosyltransferase family 4 protein [Pelistega sp.]
MKILYTNFLKGNGGGHVTYIINLLKILSLHHECHVASPESSRLYRFAQEMPGVRSIAQSFHSRLPLMCAEIKQIRALLKRERYDIVHVNGSADHRHLVLACLGLKHRPKIVFTKHNDHRLKSFGNRMRALGTDSVIAVSQYVLSLFQGTAYQGIPIRVVYHGVDTDYFAPCQDQSFRDQQRQSLVGPEHAKLILIGSSGGTDYEKGWLEMVEAVSLLPQEQRQQCRIIVAGDYPDPQKIQVLVDLGMQESVIFPGLLDDVRPLLLACDIGFVLSHKEALSFACRESMALGLPTIVSDAGGLPENIRHQDNGWIVPVKNPQALAQLLETILPNHLLRQETGQAARKTAENEFNLRLFTQNTLLCYDEVLQHKRHSR